MAKLHATEAAQRCAVPVHGRQHDGRGIAPAQQVSGIQQADRNPGYEVRAAAVGSRAIELFRSWRPDVVLLDIAMPVLGGLAAVEQLIGDEGYCFGSEPGLADVYLIPQLYAAERFNVDLQAYPRIRRVAALAASHPAFAKAHPGNQPDTP